MIQTKKIALLALFSMLLCIAAILNRYTYHVAQILFTVIYVTGILMMNVRGAALSIAALAGLIYSFQSALGPLVISAWLVRGTVTEGMFTATKIYEDARNGRYSFIKITVSMITASFITGLFFYYFFVHIMRILPDFGITLVLSMFSISAVWNGVGSFIVAKYLMPRMIRAYPLLILSR